VQPIYVSVGLAWEAAERAVVERLLAASPFRDRMRPLAALSVDMRDVYAANHWAVEGRPPSYHTPDEDVYLPGRNVILLGKAGVFCAAAAIGRLVIGTLEHNPFPDATPLFREAMQRALTLGLGHKLSIEAPFSGMSKADVIRRGVALDVPLELSLSCMNPKRSGQSGHRPLATGHYVHCGTCSKCRERHDAFLEAGVADPTEYVERANLA
jgi:7-cyano-7-deazaguanine synthase